MLWWYDDPKPEPLGVLSVEYAAFLHSFVLQDFVPRVSLKQSPKQAKVFPLEFQGNWSPDYALLPSPRIKSSVIS